MKDAREKLHCNITDEHGRGCRVPSIFGRLIGEGRGSEKGKGTFLYWPGVADWKRHNFCMLEKRK